MIVLFDSDQRTKRMMDELLEKGEYTGISQLISVAVANQYTLEFSGSTLAEQLDLSGADGRTDVSVRNAEVGRVPSLFRLKGSYEEVPQAELKSSKLQKRYPVSEWLFGQYNRVLPAKVSCRAIMNLCNGEVRSFEEMSSAIAEEAAVLGSVLRALDEQNQVDRYRALAIAFPEEGPDAHKSRSRYQNHFVGSLSSEGELAGLLADLKLVVLERSGDTLPLKLTSPGYHFARLTNPILDTAVPGNERFSEAEVDLVLSHVEAHVPREAFAYISVLKGLAEGIDSPKELDLFFKDQGLTSSNFSESFLSSQRSGAISRMTDLALVRRERDGVRVRYVATVKGQQFLKKMEGA